MLQLLLLCIVVNFAINLIEKYRYFIHTIRMCLLSFGGLLLSTFYVLYDYMYFYIILHVDFLHLHFRLVLFDVN